MKETSSKLTNRHQLSNRRSTPVGMRLLYCLLFIVAVCVPSLAHGAALPGAPGVTVGPGAPFAVADFDGDHRPDLASVQGESGGSSSTDDYWIRLRLSASGKSYIRVAAPRGGLLIEARDVNGDHAVDLVFATAWLGQPVAIFLNDGHGNFSQADPAAFPDAFPKSKAVWGSMSDRSLDVTGIPQESPSGLFRLARGAIDSDRQTGSLRLPDAELLPNSFLIPRAGRAPPLEISL